jgi:SpoVK/Ycf46/Vps4 family AAA+-type ATPase
VAAVRSARFAESATSGASPALLTGMKSPLLSFFSGRLLGRSAVETITPQRTFADVILPPSTHRTLEQALAQVRNQALIFGHWGLGERHSTGLGLAFNFAGPPGTGKTICAEAIAGALGKQLLVVNYAEVESMWMGETPKNVAAVFRAAAEQDAVLLFDEADAIAGRRSSGAALPHQREANTTVNVLLKELEGFNGVVIFATNLAANFDPAFERRIRTHVLFEMPGPEERERIWQVQVHPMRTPLASDVNFTELAARFPVSGGDIKNAVLKAAAMAAAEPGSDAGKRIHQGHFVAAMESVVAGKSVMQQSVFASDGEDPTIRAIGEAEARWRAAATVALGMGAVALIAAVIALVVALAR